MTRGTLAFLLSAVAAGAQEEPRAVEDIRRELAGLPRYGVFDLISFEYEKGMVTLAGSVAEPSLKKAAENAVRRIEGVEQVANRIETLPHSAADEKLRKALYRAIYVDSPLSRYGTGDDGAGAAGPRAAPLSGLEPIGVHAIHIVVNRGDVLLAGRVRGTEDKQLAELKAKGVFGVRTVVNALEVSIRPD
jgi:osmotically-inducible protein OsmY